MNTVIKGTKTIAEYKRVREDMENLARANYARHKEAFEEWGEGELTELITVIKFKQIIYIIAITYFLYLSYCYYAV